MFEGPITITNEGDLHAYDADVRDVQVNEDRDRNTVVFKNGVVVEVEFGRVFLWSCDPAARPSCDVVEGCQNPIVECLGGTFWYCVAHADRAADAYHAWLESDRQSRRTVNDRSKWRIR